jgi:hypothetical protein
MYKNEYKSQEMGNCLKSVTFSLAGKSGAVSQYKQKKKVTPFAAQAGEIYVILSLKEIALYVQL